MSLREEFENPAAQAEFLGVVRISKIIWAALLIGPLAFGGVIAFLTLSQPNDSRIGVITLVMAAFSAMVVVVRLVLPNLIANQQVQAIAQGRWTSATHVPVAPQSDLGKLGLVYQQRMIIASALLEGATFANLTAVMMERNLLAVAISVVLWLGLAAGMPTASRALEWGERQLRYMHELRSMK